MSARMARLFAAVLLLPLTGSTAPAAPPAPSLNTITQVSVHDGAVEIVGSRRPNFTTITLSDPPRLVIDLAEAVFVNVPEDIPVKDSNFVVLKTAGYGSGQTAIARVLIGFSRDVETDIQSTGARLVIRVSGTEVPPDAGAPLQVAQAKPPTPDAGVSVAHPDAGGVAVGEAEAKRQAEEQKRQQEAEAKRQAEEQKRQQEAEAKRQAEEQKKQQEAEAKRQAEEQKRQQEAEAKRQAEEQKKQQEAEAKRQAEEQKRQAAEEKRAEAQRRQEEAEAKRQAAADAKRVEAQKRQEEAEAKRRAEEQKRQEEAEAKRRVAEELQAAREQARQQKLAREQTAREERAQKAQEAEERRLEARRKAQAAEEARRQAKVAAAEARAQAQAERHPVTEAARPPEAVPPASGKTAVLQFIGFQPRPQGGARVYIRTSAPVRYSVSETKGALVVEVKNAQVGGNAARPLDTSFFSTPVLSARAVAVGDGVRVEIRLRGRSSYQVHQDGTQVSVELDRR